LIPGEARIFGKKSMGYGNCVTTSAKLAWMINAMNRILFNWYYYRPDLTQYILETFADQHLYFLFYAKEEPVPEYLKKYSNVTIFFWNDFSTPYKLLRSINPDCIVFHDIESFYQVGLNIAARNCHILTFVLQHGLRSGYDVNFILENNSPHQKITVSDTSFKTLFFFLSSLRFKNLSATFSLIRFIIDRKTLELTSALKRNQFPLRNADYYIEFSELNTTYHRERDNIPDDRFIITGNPLFDGFINDFKTEHTNKKEGDYVLLIDAPFERDNGADIPRLTLEEKNRYLLQIANLSSEAGLPLKVKLHPKSYSTTDLVSAANLSYCRNENMIQLAKDAQYVIFIHYSSVSPIISFYKECVYINMGGEVQKKLFDLVGMKGFSMEEIIDSKLKLGDIAKHSNFDQLEKLLYTIDGMSALKVKRAIMDKIELGKKEPNILPA
jgi:hypothetical protein